jgi:hypothetical protein
MTSALCPTCGTPNPPHSLFCEKCGTRLTASLAEEPEAPETPAPAAFVPKGLSLPTKTTTELEPAAAAAPAPVESPAPAEPAKPVEEEPPDWLQVVQSAVAGTSELDIEKVTAASSAADAEPEEIPAWLAELGIKQSGPLKKSPTDELLPEWAQRLRTMPESAQPPAPDEEVPDWLKTLGTTGQLPSMSEMPSAAAALPPNTAAPLEAAAVVPAEPAAEEELPDWLKTFGATGQLPSVSETPSADVALPPVTAALAESAAEDELPEWLKEPATPYSSTEPETLPAAPLAAAPAPPAEEEIPDWLRDLRPTASTDDALPDWLDELGVEEQPASGSMALSSGDSALDWLSQLGATAPGAEPLVPEAAAEPAVTPDWMSSLRASTPEVDTQPTEEAPDWMQQSAAPQPAFETTAAAETPDWLSSFRAAPPEPVASAEEEGVPDWLKGAGLAAGAAALGAAALDTTAEPQPEEAAPSKPVTDWLAALRQATPEMEAGQAQSEEEVPAWMSEESGAAPQAIGGVQSYDQEVPDWLRQAGAATQQSAPAAEEEVPDWLRATSAPVESVETPPPAQSEEEGMPDWLKGLGAAAVGAAAFGAVTEEQPEEVAPQKPATDWLSALRQATPELEAEQAQAEEKIPAWLPEESGAAPQAIGGVPAYDQEVPDWLRESGTAPQQPVPTAEEEIPDWLRATPEPISSTEPAASAEEEGVPDWLKGAGLAAGAVAFGAFATEQPEEAPSEKPATDWLTALRRATPEMEAAGAQAEEEVPAWMQEEASAAPQAIGGVQAYDQEVPDWLRESGPVSAVAAPADENVPDWLREESGVSFTPAPPLAEVEEDENAPDWLKGLGVAAAGAAAVAASRAQEPADENLPDWLREETTPPVQLPAGEIPDWLQEAEPAPALTFEAPVAAEAEAGETPDWLREFAPAAAAGSALAAAEPVAEEPEEIEQPEEVVEAEPEESWVTKAAPIAAAGVATAAVIGARKPEKAEAAPAEIPDWLKEIRQEQQVSQTAIPVPPPEAAGLMQAEIPAWLEALRPTEEAAVPQEAETPSETEGPLAGIANALPPAPIMGQMTGLPAKLQYAISAEDQARSGVLKELLTQHAVAPASVEQFLVKGSAIRRRMLRWVVTFLMALALLTPIAFNINERTGLPLLPDAMNMVVPIPNQNAAVEIAKLAQLPAQAKVLIVFDYDAAQAGEMDYVATALLRSPALSNAQLQIASLNPQGNSVAQAVLNQLPGLRYTNLGFVPGQINGVQAVLSRAGDVNMIIDLAASPETVRWWAEQLKANRATTLLVAGISAGAEPLTMPYVQSGQVKGLVSGYAGSIAYLNMIKAIKSTDQPAQYQLPLEGLALANYVMVALIVVGGLMALLRGAGRRSA